MGKIVLSVKLSQVDTFIFIFVPQDCTRTRDSSSVVGVVVGFQILSSTVTLTLPLSNPSPSS